MMILHLFNKRRMSSLKRKPLVFLIAAVLTLGAMGVTAPAAECPPETPDAEPLFEYEGFFMGRLDGDLVLLFQKHDGGSDVRLTLDRDRASDLFSYALEARNAAPGMNPFITGDAQVPKPQRPLEPLLLKTVEGQAVWACVAGRDYRNGAFFADFLLAPAGEGNKPDSSRMLALTIYETPPSYPKEEPLINKETGLPAESPGSPGPKWGEEFSGFLSALQAFTGAKVLIGM